MQIKGKDVTWENVSREHLKHLLVDENMTAAAIAEGFGVSVSKVQYKKKKYGLTSAYIMFEKFAKGEDKELMDSINEIAKDWFLDAENIDAIAKSITNYVFRQGPVENIHTEGKPITDRDMKAINIYMVNHIAGLLACAIDGNWVKLQLLISYFNKGMSEWEPAKPELGKIEDISTRLMNKAALADMAT